MTAPKLIKSITSRYELTILIPALNEEFTIERLINETKKAMGKTNINYCILVSDNNSQDRTLDIISNKNVLINKCKKRGYGANLIDAINKIRSRYTIFFDADGSYNPNFIKILFQEIKKKQFDLITFNRLKKQEYKSMPFLNKYLGTPILSFLIRAIYGIEVYDNNAGMRIFETFKIRSLKLKCTGMEFASEMLIKLSINNLRYKELILKFRRDYRNSPPHLKRFSDGIRHLKCIFLHFTKSRIFTIPARLKNIV
jgi:glycosyltransferase involved in cell wall biosynthesis